MCYGFHTGTSEFPGVGLDRFVSVKCARKTGLAPVLNFGKVDISASFAALSAVFPCQEAGDRGSRVPCAEGGATCDAVREIAEIKVDPNNETDYGKQCPKGKSAAKGGSGGGAKSGGGGTGGASAGGSAVSPSSSSSSSSAGAGAPGGGRPPGKSPSKTPSPAMGTPKKRPRRSTRRSTTTAATSDEAAAPAANETADEAAAALAAIESAPSTSTSTLLTSRQVRAAAAKARKEKREELKKKAQEEAAAAAKAAADAAAAGKPAPARHSKPSASAIAKAATKAVSTTAAAAATPPTASGFPQYKCCASCECNNFTREKLREKESTEGSEREHCRENLSFMRWVQLRRDNLEIKELLRENKTLLTSQNELLQEVLGASKEAATIRASEDLAADDKGELLMPWTDMDQSVAAFSTMPKRQMLYRILHRIVCKLCHFPRMAMREMFAPPLQQRVYPIAKPNSHSRRSSAWRYGYKYHILPKVTLDFIAFVMSKKYVGMTSELAIQEVKDHLNDARETAKDADKTTFYGKLDQPVYLLVWRDSEAKTFVIEETPPYDGDEEAKEAFMARWEEAVNDEIAEKHPNGFIHKNPPAP